MPGLIPRLVTPGMPAGLAPAGRAASPLPLVFPNKQAAEALDYAVDFSAALADTGDSLSSFTVAITPATSPPLAETAPPAPPPYATATMAVFFLSGGLAGAEYTVTVTAITAGGRTLQAAASLYIPS